MSALLFALPGNESMAAAIAGRLGAATGALELRRFPDGETYLRFRTSPAGHAVALVCTLDRPDDKILPLIFAAATARELGATGIGLIAPYLAYMRQDRRFRIGEAVTSREVARLVSRSFDWLVTVDPHLHRLATLAEIYSVPADVVHAAPLISDWVKQHVHDPLLIGPDSESEQWVAAVARAAGAPFTVLDKVRHGDRDVTVSIRNDDLIGRHTPVLMDDIISSGRTLLAAAALIKKRTTAAPLALAVHGLFAERADELLQRAGVRVVTCNTIAHRSNAIDISGLLAQAVQRRLGSAAPSGAGELAG